MDAVVYSNWVDLLRARAREYPDRIAFTFLSGKAGESQGLSYGELDLKARAVAATLQGIAPAEKQVLLLYPPGLEYVVAYYGCQYAGLVAVPLYPPQGKRKLASIEAIAVDSRARIALTTAAVLERSESRKTEFAGLGGLQWISSEQIEDSAAAHWRMPDVGETTIAYLQYTSGSTSDPKGVIIDHGTSLYQCLELVTKSGTDRDSVLLSWLPHFHDFGHVYSVLHPVYLGFHSVLMPPATLVTQPHEWLRALSDYQATHTAAPDFAYRHCVETVRSEQLTGIDLSKLRMAINGAEPVHWQTLKMFHQAYASLGFDWNAFTPGYGMAEATLFVSSAEKFTGARGTRFSTESLLAGRALECTDQDEDGLTLVSCGKTLFETRVIICDPRTSKRTSDIGEIWVRGRSVARGYWGNNAATDATFGAFLADGDGPFLRTGDMGFIHDGELYIAGRIKDLIIIRGANHYPNDIEHTVDRCHPSLRPGHCAAFSVERDGEEELVVVAELKRYDADRPELGALIENIREAVSEKHGLDAYAICLVKPGVLSKTTSGKIQRRACRTQFLAGGMATVESWHRPQVVAAAPEPAVEFDDIIRRQLTDWVVSWISNAKSLPREHVDLRQSFGFYGLNSLSAFNLLCDAEALLGTQIAPEIVMESESIGAMISVILSSIGADVAEPA